LVTLIVKGVLIEAGDHDYVVTSDGKLFEAEKELTRRSCELARGRQELPWPQSGVMTGALVDYDQCVAGAYPE
jgi:hypothetical protein